MEPFVRPPVDQPVFYDADGDVIDYGRRWWPTGDEGPDDTYSVTLHPERFAPLLVVARALIDHLERTYDVIRSTVRDTTVLDPGGSSAPLRFELTPFPLVRCTAGAESDIAWFCACDHCDEDLLVATERLEREVSAVVDGRLREWLEESDDGWWVRSRFITADGSDDSHGSKSRVEQGRVTHQQEVFRHVPERWAPWTLRSRS